MGFRYSVNAWILVRAEYDTKNSIIKLIYCYIKNIYTTCKNISGIIDQIARIKGLEGYSRARVVRGSTAQKAQVNIKKPMRWRIGFYI
ncbi:hypothetical protein [Aliagarivorans marinus]|uniref:hypothetical protein n=1 Tax=Aliagarivorans marinus TaxID=561965 RepID=UPI00047CD0BB|nr:hypothetical protein [Aliagarivorans marinus]